MHVFGVAEKAPGSGPGIESLFVGGKRPVVINSRDFLATITGRDRPASGAFIRPPWINACRDRAHRGTELRDGLGIFERERCPRAFVRGEPAGVDAGIEAEDERRCGAVATQTSV